MSGSVTQELLPQLPSVDHKGLARSVGLSNFVYCLTLRAKFSGWRPMSS